MNKNTTKTTNSLSALTLSTIAAALSLFLAGCVDVYRPAPLPPHTFYYSNPQKDLTEVGRVVLVELLNGTEYPSITEDVTEALYHEMQKKQIFGVAMVSRNDPSWRQLQLGPNDTYTLEQLVRIKHALACDALMVGTVTDYKPYPHMSISAKLKIIDLDEGMLLWAIDHTWDTSDQDNAIRIDNYFKTQKRSGFRPIGEELVNVSPLEFIKYVSYEVASTMQADD